MIIRIILIYIFACNTAFAEIRQVSDLDLVRKEVYASSKDTFVVFDVDFTIVNPTDQIFSHSSTQEYQKFYSDIKARRTEEDMRRLWSIILISAPSQVLESNTKSVLKRIQKRNKNMFFLTALQTGKFGHLNCIEKWRIKELKKMGFALSNKFPETDYHDLDPYLKRVSPDCSPVFKHGILFGCFVAKGEVLGAYLRYINVKPKKIIFVDDRRDHVESVAKYCKKHGIAYVGFEYTAWKNRKTLPANNARTTLQAEVLENAEAWLSDEKADKILAMLNSNCNCPKREIDK